MAINNFGLINDPRDMYGGYNAHERYEREMQYRRQQEEEEYRRMQNSHYADALRYQPQLANTTSKPDPKDPLSFLSKADTKILLTGEAT
jgi:hypothetical protein